MCSTSGSRPSLTCCATSTRTPSLWSRVVRLTSPSAATSWPRARCLVGARTGHGHGCTWRVGLGSYVDLKGIDPWDSPIDPLPKAVPVLVCMALTMHQDRYYAIEGACAVPVHPCLWITVPWLGQEGSSGVCGAWSIPLCWERAGKKGWGTTGSRMERVGMGRCQ